MSMVIKLAEKCGRCSREDTVEVGIDEAVARVKAHAPKEKALVIVIDGKEAASYDYLCEECRGIVSGYCAAAAQKQRKKSARRFKRVRAEHSERAPAHPGRLKTPHAI
jgi:hypothetical protein